MNIGDVLISKDYSYTHRDYVSGNCVGKSVDLETIIFLDDYFTQGKKYFVKKITNDRVYISSYKNVHINGIFDLDIKSEFYWFKFFTTQSNIRDEKLKELGI
jgi:hypothetical protein